MYINPITLSNQNKPAPGLLELTPEQEAVYLQYNGFVTVEETEDGVVVTPRVEAWEAWKAEQPDPLNTLKDAKQEENKAALAAWLAAHPLQWTDGKHYGVEEQDQNEMALNLMQYQAAAMASQVAPLEWHAQKEACREFTQEEYLSLSMAISNYVYPYRRHQESIKEAIYSATTQEELEAIVIDYSSVTNE